MSDSANPVWNPWANDTHVLALYRRRCRQESEEMTCAAQAAEILADKITPGETLLDAGCGSGYYYWSFLKRNIAVNYSGLDYTPEMIELAREEMCMRTDLRPEHFTLGSIENLNQNFENIVCFNVLTNSPHYALPLGRLLECSTKRILIRESLSDELTIRYTPDPYLDEAKRHIRVYHNTYPLREVVSFMEEYGYRVTSFVDRRSQGDVEMVVDIPHYWHILLGEKL